MVRVVIPVADGRGERLSEHFGRAPYFAWFEVRSGRSSRGGSSPTRASTSGGAGHPPDRILQLRPDVVITVGMGWRALSRFQGAGVAVLQAAGSRTDENLARFIGGELTELTEGCLDARRR